MRDEKLRTIITDDSVPEMADVAGMSKLSPTKKKEGKIVFRKGGKSEANIMDQRAMTNDDSKAEMERLRLEYEKKIGDMIKGMK